MTTEPELKAKKKPVNGRSKGHGFELTIAKLFSERFAPLVFKRTPGSGAYIGGANARHQHDYSDEARNVFAGDVFPANAADVARAEGWSFRFSIECKFYKEADSFTSLFKNPQVRGWFEQAATDAAKLAGKEALLVCKFNHTPVYAAVAPSVALPDNITASMQLRYNCPDGRTQELVIVHLSELLEHVEWFKRSPTEEHP